MKRLLVLLILATFAISGCTGTAITVTPPPDSLKSNYTGKCGAVAVKEFPTPRVYPPAGNLVPGFANALERSGLATQVYYPARPDDKVDLVLDARFDVNFDANMGANMTKGFFIGLTLFLLEPVIWHDFDYQLEGQVSLLKDKQKVRTINSKTTANMSMKWLSLGEAAKLEGETLSQSKESLYRQLLNDLDSYCREARQ